MVLYWIFLIGFFSGCKSASHDGTLSADKVRLLEDAKMSMDAGEYYRARKIVQEILEEEPGDAAAETLMAEVIDREIARQRGVFETKAREEMSSDERAGAAKTWIERAEALLEIREYEQALLAAEKVFMYEPENIKASQLIDKIKKQASAHGRGESLILRQIYEGEVHDRIERYRIQAHDWMESGRWGAARLAVEKILLLNPEDREGLALYEKIQKHRENRKT